MATAPLSISRVKSWGDAWVATWTLGDADSGAACEMIQASDKSIQITGTFGSATVVIQGSNDGSNWRTLNDPSNSALSFTSAGLEAILEHTRYIRPTSSGGTESDIDVTIFMRGQKN